jgi:hypothetical protein
LSHGFIEKVEEMFWLGIDWYISYPQVPGAVVGGEPLLALQCIIVVAGSFERRLSLVGPTSFFVVDHG